MSGIGMPWLHEGWALLVLGVLAGVMSGALGLGSGTIIIPGLVLLLGLSQKAAQGMSLAAMIPMVCVAAILYRARVDSSINIGQIALMVLGGVLGALLGVQIAVYLPGGVLRKVFACYLLAAGVHMLFTPEARKRGATASVVDSDARGMVPQTDRSDANDADSARR